MTGPLEYVMLNRRLNEGRRNEIVLVPAGRATQLCNAGYATPIPLD